MLKATSEKPLKSESYNADGIKRKKFRFLKLPRILHVSPQAARFLEFIKKCFEEIDKLRILGRWCMQIPGIVHENCSLSLPLKSFPPIHLLKPRISLYWSMAIHFSVLYSQTMKNLPLFNLSSRCAFSRWDIGWDSSFESLFAASALWKILSLSTMLIDATLHLEARLLTINQPNVSLNLIDTARKFEQKDAFIAGAFAWCSA